MFALFSLLQNLFLMLLAHLNHEQKMGIIAHSKWPLRKSLKMFLIVFESFSRYSFTSQLWEMSQNHLWTLL